MMPLASVILFFAASYAIPPKNFMPLNTVPPALIAALPRSFWVKPKGEDEEVAGEGRDEPVDEGVDKRRGWCGDGEG